MIKKIAFLFCAMVALAFVACGDSNTSEVVENYYDSVATLESGGKLSRQRCDSTKLGKILLVVDSNEVFFCDGNSWNPLKGVDGEKGDVGDKGAKGETGDKGDKGERGDKGDIGDTGKSGADGFDGIDGGDGDGCSIVNDEGGIVTIACGDKKTSLYRVMCSDQPYDPETHFCLNDVLYEKANHFVDVRDNHVYRTITIGEGENAKIWMAENLNYIYNEGSGRSRCYEDNLDNCEKYGRLYTWSAAVDSAGFESDDCKGCGNYLSTDSNWVKPPEKTVRGVCPQGWHLPDTLEFNALRTMAADSVYENSGINLKSKSGWSSDFKKNDKIGFSVLPSGYSPTITSSEFYGMHKGAYLFVLNELDGFTRMVFCVNSEEEAYFDRSAKATLISVRCVKN